jgi:signal transduction histidine kinase
VALAAMVAMTGSGLSFLLIEYDDKSRKLAAADAAKSDFLANMSHELRTPLNAVIGFSEMLSQGYVGPVSEKQAEYLGDIRASSAHLLALINTMLDMTKIELGRYELHDDLVDLGDLIKTALSLLRVHAEHRQVHLAEEALPDPPQLRADRGALLQVLMNLLTNAIDLTAAGGRVALSCARGDDGSVSITVADESDGIEPHLLPHLFEPFQRGDPAVARRPGATGLGLTISRTLVERHGGEVTVASRRGVGTAAVVRLPAERVVARTP